MIINVDNSTVTFYADCLKEEIDYALSRIKEICK